MIGTILACDERHDLRESRKGDGRCAFSFVPARTLQTFNTANLRVCRAVDGSNAQLYQRGVAEGRLTQGHLETYTLARCVQNAG
jgi:hypothetical protein